MFLSFAGYQAISFSFHQVNALAWGAMIYFGAVFTVLAYVLWFRGVSDVPGTTAGVFTAVMPVSAVTLSAIFFEDVLTWSHVVGGSLVISAVLMTALDLNHLFKRTGERQKNGISA
jgi:drug/metabolite transporter (DMT)-like permease